MLTIAISIGVLFIFLLISEFLAHHGIVGPELKRKSFHVLSGSFIAFWPWLMSWKTIEVLGLSMAVAVSANYFVRVVDFTKKIGRRTYGDLFLALAIAACARYADSKMFFAVAILNVSLADGLAALIGQRYGKSWAYKVLGQSKTVIGTMTFWLVSLCVTAICLLFDRGEVSFGNYVGLIIVLPPAMAALENFSFWGVDNLTVPLAALAILQSVN